MGKKKLGIRIGLIAIFIICQILCVYMGYTFSTYHKSTLTDKMLVDSGIKSTNKLMIVAHPDDDSIWGGGHLMDGDYYIVVLTNGNNARRKCEFKKMLETSGNKGIILSYPDKTYGKKDSWKKSKEEIKKDISRIMKYKDWDLIVTHNKEGEYGHIHHKMTHRFVTDIYDEQKPDCKLYFFGKYYTKSQIGDVEDSLPRISQEQLEFKEKLEDIYKSQDYVVEMFCQMNPFEDWTCYNEQGED
ncbi:MAG: PIG-L family deacetylase [Ruminococcus sp.]|nr:PIG-L family deacetylase [Ruminococcus sp.]HRR76511.1 PIG-L family deacetylase [Ruminococcus sp.]